MSRSLLLISFFIFSSMVSLTFSLTAKALKIQTGTSCLTPVEKLELDSEMMACRKDEDCAIVDEACRSCQSPIAVHYTQLDRFEEIDEAARVEDDCVITCEACDQSNLEAICIKNKCVAQVTTGPRVATAIPLPTVKSQPPTITTAVSPPSKSMAKKSKSTPKKTIREKKQ
jgi:hypothetical protein